MKVDPIPYVMAFLLTAAVVTIAFVVYDLQVEIDRARDQIAFIREEEAIRLARSYCRSGVITYSHVGGRIETVCGDGRAAP